MVSDFSKISVCAVGWATLSLVERKARSGRRRDCEVNLRHVAFAVPLRH